MKMAYSPTTWNTNDVITKDKLNKIEQGVKTATRLSGTDIDADKDWNGKNITNSDPARAVRASRIVTF
jgi:oligoribonuclease (3'-5' exoribonuclease)